MKTVEEAWGVLLDWLRCENDEEDDPCLGCNKGRDAARALALAAARRVIDYDVDGHYATRTGQGKDESPGWCCSYHLLEWELSKLEAPS